MGRHVLITEAEKKDMFEMFDADMKIKDIIELSGRSHTTVHRFKKEWKAERNMKASTIEKKEPEVAEEKNEEVLSDYAKAYYDNNPAVVRSSFDIKRSIQIRSKKTGILYEMDDVEDKKNLTITLDDGTMFDIELGLFEKFVDEGIDVVLEVKRSCVIK